MPSQRKGWCRTVDFVDAYESWADAHAFFGASLVPAMPDPDDPLGAQKAAWTDRLALGTPNGHLLRRNALFDSLAAGGKLHLLHVTHALEKISQDGVLYPSGGCLVGSIYCAPLTATGHGFRPHNLGSYVLTREAPAFLAKIGRMGHEPTPLVFELDLPPQAYQSWPGWTTSGSGRSTWPSTRTSNTCYPRPSGTSCARRWSAG